ncbi:hypothetical protein GIB67_017848, partial [Kingdonia uniflora]
MISLVPTTIGNDVGVGVGSPCWLHSEVVSRREPRGWSVVVVAGLLALGCTPISSTSQVSASITNSFSI